MNQAYEGLKSIVKVCVVAVLGIFKFIFDSIFPPIIQVFSKERCNE